MDDSLLVNFNGLCEQVFNVLLFVGLLAVHNSDPELYSTLVTMEPREALKIIFERLNLNNVQ